MSQPGASAAIELELVGATESAEPLHKKGFATIETDGAGARALTRSVDRDAIVWDLATGKRVEGAWIRLHPDGRRGLRAEADGTVALADIASGEKIATLEGAIAAAPPWLGPGRFAAQWLPLVAKDQDRPFPETGLWDLETGKRAAPIVHAGLLGAALPGDRFLIVDAKGQPTLFDGASGSAIATLKGPKDKPVRLVVAPGGKTAVTVTKKGTACLWDLEARALVGSTETLAAQYGGGEFPFVELLSDGRRIAIAEAANLRDGLVAGLVDVPSGAFDPAFKSSAQVSLRGIAAVPGGPVVAVHLGRGIVGAIRVELWDVDHLRLVGAVDAPLARVMALAGGDRLVVAGNPNMGGTHYLRVYRLVRREGAGWPAAPEGAPAPREAPPALAAMPAPAPAEEASAKRGAKAKSKKS